MSVLLDSGADELRQLVGTVRRGRSLTHRTPSRPLPVIHRQLRHEDDHLPLVSRLGVCDERIERGRRLGRPMFIADALAPAQHNHERDRPLGCRIHDIFLPPNRAKSAFVREVVRPAARLGGGRLLLFLSFGLVSGAFRPRAGKGRKRHTKDDGEND